MAEKRMISKVISISKKFNLSLNDHFSRLLYILLIPHSDDFGRLTGDPFKIKALILPMMNDVSWEEVEKSLSKLHNAELIIWYESTGEMFIQIINFDNHQQGLHKRTRSKFPEPPTVSRKFPEIPLEEKGTELNRTEEKGIEGKGTEEKKPSHNFLPIINKLNLKCKGIWEMEQLESYLTTMEPELIEEALKRSEHKGSVAYALGILPDWNAKGLKTLEDIKPKAGEGSEKHQGQPQHGGTDSKNKSITGDAIGWLPSAARPANYTQLLEVSGQ